MGLCKRDKDSSSGQKEALEQRRFLSQRAGTPRVYQQAKDVKERCWTELCSI